MTLYKVGDVVRCKNGGPLLIVTHLQENEDQNVHVRWFDRDLHCQRETFSPETLERVPVEHPYRDDAVGVSR